MAKVIQTHAKTKKRAPVKAKAVAKPVGKAKAPGKASMTLQLNTGDWLDVMDSEGTWNVAQIIEVRSNTEVKVKYDGWGNDYNEVIPINTGRMAPFHTYTWAVKCWAKYLDWPWWPAIVTFRPPGTVEGQSYLADETRMFVDFLDNADINKRCRSWIEQKKIKPFNDTTNEQYRKPNSTGFEASLERLLLSSASEAFAPLVKGGTLPVEFKSKLALSVKKVKAELGNETWIQSMNSSQMRHGKIYAYQPAVIKDDLGFDVEDLDEDPHGDLGDFEPRIDDKPSKKRTTSATPKTVKTERSASSKRPRLKGEAPALAQADHEGRILDGPHAPSPNSDDEEDSTVEEPVFLPVPDEQAAFDAADSSDDDEQSSRVSKRLRVQRKKETSPVGGAVSQDSAKTQKAQLAVEHADISTRPRQRRISEDHESEESEAATVTVVLEPVGEPGASDSGAGLSSPETATGEEDVEVPVELALPSDDDTSQQDMSEDLGAVDNVDEEPEEIERTELDEETKETAVEDEEDEVPADPLDDWGATRSSGVEELIEVGEADSAPQPQATEESALANTRVGSPAEEIGREAITVQEQHVGGEDIADDCVAAPDSSSAVLKGKAPPRPTAGAKRKSTNLRADAEKALLSLLAEDKKPDETAQNKKQTAKSSGFKTTKAATKAPAKQPPGKAAPVRKAPSKKALAASSNGSANGGQSRDPGIDAKQAIVLRGSDSGPGNGRDASRRSSMRAGGIGHGAMPRGKTPVWVVPPPMSEAPISDDSSPMASSSLKVPIVPTSPSFSSDLSFHSASPFKIGTWIESITISADLDT